MAAKYPDIHTHAPRSRETWDAPEEQAQAALQTIRRNARDAEELRLFAEMCDLTRLLPHSSAA